MFMFSGVTPPSSFQTKEWIREPNIKCNILIANGKPGHILLPAPNGISSKFRPLTSSSDPKNLSGLNESGSSHILGSLPMAHALTSTCAPFGTVEPSISTSDSAFRGSSKGTAGCIRNVSLIMACK
ncbi:hypothetical protein RchiOBHm_Chr7g0200261 [Rosa chinensis]|uniref:Uncharacterized protein n=1 Tax=Rosa chinensis TaxID=74649 RepID=A0A2P6P7L1_ROSCH|nr:hypothetical protein RchiOBHm_Chr7g0200261 [Rosa chinensis]